MSTNYQVKVFDMRNPNLEDRVDTWLNNLQAEAEETACELIIMNTSSSHSKLVIFYELCEVV